MARTPTFPSTSSQPQGRAGKGLRKGRKPAPVQAPAAGIEGRQEGRWVPRWDGETDAEALNDLLLRYMRAVDAKMPLPEAEQARRCRMTRQALHHLHTEVKVLTVPALIRWANGRRLNAAFLLSQITAYLQERNPRR